MIQNDTHELIQSYFDHLYGSIDKKVTDALFGIENEIYGELYYYSAAKLLKLLDITENDHFLDIGSGLGKLVFQIYLTTKAKSVTGIEIHHKRYHISELIKQKLENDLPGFFTQERSLTLIEGDFLKYDNHHPHFNDITIAYACSTVFSFPLLLAIGEKINEMKNVNKVVSLRKLPNLDNFSLEKKIFLHGSWDKTACYLYYRKN